MEYLLSETGNNEFIAVPLNIIVAVAQVERVFPIPFVKKGIFKNILAYKDKIYAIDSSFQDKEENFFILLKNSIALPVKGIIARVNESESIEEITYMQRRFLVVNYYSTLLEEGA